MTTEETRKWLSSLQGKLITRFNPVGSRITCNPPPTNTDEDWLILVASPALLDAWVYSLVKEGWDSTASYDEDTELDVCLRQNQTNLLVTSSKEYYELFMKACGVCAVLNLLDKTQRKLVHRIVTGEDSI